MLALETKIDGRLICLLLPGCARSGCAVWYVRNWNYVNAYQSHLAECFHFLDFAGVRGQGRWC